MTEWNQILFDKKYSSEEPDELVVDFVTLLRKKKLDGVLDLGCGAGRHVICLAKHKFETYGLDLSDTGLKMTKERLERQGLEAFLTKCHMKSLPYIDSSFDAIISLHTIYHQRLTELQETISEIHRILKRKGVFLVNFHSKRSSKYGEGVKIEEGTFIQQEDPERGVLHHFIDKEELESLFKNFKIIHKTLSERKYDGYLRSLWIIMAEKP